MGSGGSKSPPANRGRSDSAQSWIARNQYAISDGKANGDNKRSRSGKFRYKDTLKEIAEADEYVPDSARDGHGTPRYMFKGSRELGDGFWGVRNNRKIAKQAHKLSQNDLWVDGDFRGDDKALCINEPGKFGQATWERPENLSAKPRMVAHSGYRPNNVTKGLYDSPLIAPFKALCLNKLIINKVVPYKGSLNDYAHKGYVRSMFWRFGEWIDVFVDDKVPVRETQLLFCCSRNPDEYWTALVEKSYAKLHGSYEGIHEATMQDCMTDLTGGLVETFILDDNTTKVAYGILARAASDKNIMFATKTSLGFDSAPIGPDIGYDKHAGEVYHIVDVKRITRTRGAELLLKLRNPHIDNGAQLEEWKGAWCDGDDRWSLVTDETKEWMKYVERKDGMYWMSFKDFCKHFEMAVICTIEPSDFPELADECAADCEHCRKKHAQDAEKRAHVEHEEIWDNSKRIIKIVDGEWVADKSSGGSRICMEAFATNPQYMLTVHEADDQDPSIFDPQEPQTTCSVIIALMQEHRRDVRDEHIAPLNIGFCIYKMEPDYNEDGRPQRVELHQLLDTPEETSYGPFEPKREVLKRFNLEPGKYVIVPSTYRAEQPGRYLLRAYAMKDIDLCDMHNPDSECVCSVCNKAREKDEKTETCREGTARSTYRGDVKSARGNGSRALPGAIDVSSDDSD